MFWNNKTSNKINSFLPSLYFLLLLRTKRGFTSQNVDLASLSLDTGKVVDVEVMSRYSAPLEKSDPDKFENFQEHYKSDCRINHMGSAPPMEDEKAEGTMNICKRSMGTKGL